MVRRDDFVLRYTQLNNPAALNQQVQELETYVDAQLTTNANLLNYINQNGLAGTNGMLLSQEIDGQIINQAVHQDPTTLDNGSGRFGPNLQYAIWSDKITTTNKIPANTTPWNNLTIDSGSVSGELHIPLPANTNKNAAYMLLQQYLGPLEPNTNLITTDQISNNGFWGRKPILGSNGTSAMIDPNAVRLVYDATAEVFVMIFKL